MFVKENYKKMELRLHHIIYHLYNIFLENDGLENCAQLIEEEFNKMIGMNDEHDCNVVSMHSLNIHDASDMQIHKLGDAMFDEDDIFSPPRFDIHIFIMIACLLFMMITMMKMDLERS